ncbi:MAG: hypothetical protein AB8E87_14920 [Prochlorococcus sp.]
MLLLVLAFPVGLLSLGILVSIGLNRLQPQPQAVDSTTGAPTNPVTPAAPITRQPKKTASAYHPQDPIDALADEIFWRRHPSLSGVKLTSQQGELAREWAKIRSCDAIVDHRFYEIFPDMRGRTIKSIDTAMVLSWTAIRDQVPGCF